MAPMKAMKRAAAAAAGGARKKQAKDPAFAACAAISEALDALEGPKTVGHMLQGMLSKSLTLYKDERHSYQASAVQWVGDSLAAVDASLAGTLEQAQAKVDGAGADREAREAAAESAKAALPALEAAMKEKKEALAADYEASKAAGLAVKAAEASQKAGDAESSKVSLLKEAVEAFQKGTFGPLKENGGANKAGKTLLSGLEKMGKKFGFGSSLVLTAAVALKKEPSARGTFDTLATTQLESEIAKKIDELGSAVDAAAPARAERAAAVSGAQATREAAQAKNKASADALVEAESALAAGKDAVDAATKSVASFLPEFKKAAHALDAATKHLGAFRSGALAGFQSLSERVRPVPEEVPQVVEEVPQVAEEPEEAPPAVTEAEAAPAAAPAPADAADVA